MAIKLVGAIGTSPSTYISLLPLIENVDPISGRLSNDLFPAESVIEPPFNTKELSVS